MKAGKKSVSLLLCCLLPLLVCGCGQSGGIYANYRALEHMRLVETLGYDAEGGTVKLSAAAGGESAPALLLCRQGTGIREAVDSLRDAADRGQLFFAHTRYVVAGRDTAERSGIGDFLSYVERDESLRLNTELFLIEKGSAAELVTASEESFDVTEALSSAREDAAARGIAVQSFRDVAVDLSEYGAALVCMVRTERPSEGELLVFPCGCGILDRDGVLAGVLETDAAEAAGLLLGERGTADRTLDFGEGSVTLQFQTDSLDMIPAWEADGRPGPLSLRLRVAAGLAEMREEGGDAKNAPPDSEVMAERLSTELEKELRDLLSLSRSLNADFLALGRALRLSDGAKFAALPAGWLNSMEFDVTVETVIARGSDLRETEDKG